MNYKLYQVLGVYDNGQVYHDSVLAYDAYEAMRTVSRLMVSANELQIIGAVESNLFKLVTPSDDNGNASYASDIAGIQEEHL